MLPPVSIEPLDLWLISALKSNTLLSELTEMLGSLKSHALLILTKSSKSKNQLMDEQKLKDLLSSTCQISQRSRGSILMVVGVGGNILLQGYSLFSCSKASDANIGIIANCV